MPTPSRPQDRPPPRTSPRRRSRSLPPIPPNPPPIPPISPLRLPLVRRHRLSSSMRPFPFDAASSRRAPPTQLAWRPAISSPTASFSHRQTRRPPSRASSPFAATGPSVASVGAAPPSGPPPSRARARSCLPGARAPPGRACCPSPRSHRRQKARAPTEPVVQNRCVAVSRGGEGRLKPPLAPSLLLPLSHTASFSLFLPPSPTPFPPFLFHRLSSHQKPEKRSLSSRIHEMVRTSSGSSSP